MTKPVVKQVEQPVVQLSLYNRQPVEQAAASCKQGIRAPKRGTIDIGDIAVSVIKYFTVCCDSSYL